MSKSVTHCGNCLAVGILLGTIFQSEENSDKPLLCLWRVLSLAVPRKLENATHTNVTLRQFLFTKNLENLLKRNIKSCLAS